jgi:hypothetical protein
LDVPVLDLNDIIAGATDKTSISATPQKLPPHWSFRRFQNAGDSVKTSIPATPPAQPPPLVRNLPFSPLGYLVLSNAR